MFRVNYGNGTVGREYARRREAFQELDGLELYREFAWVQRFDAETGEWVRTRGTQWWSPRA